MNSISFLLEYLVLCFQNFLYSPLLRGYVIAFLIALTLLALNFKWKNRDLGIFLTNGCAVVVVFLVCAMITKGGWGLIIYIPSFMLFTGLCILSAVQIIVFKKAD